MKSLFILTVTLFSTLMVQAQDQNLPYYEIPEAPQEYTAETVVSRMIDGLGFRYYWATEGLREEDLNFKPTEESRSSRQTMDHIFGLTHFFLNSLKGEKQGYQSVSELSFTEVRKLTLESMREASELLRSGTSLEQSNIQYENGVELPFWNNINGPIADALWHVGQLVTFRRSSGNPYNSNANVLTGKVRN